MRPEVPRNKDISGGNISITEGLLTLSVCLLQHILPQKGHCTLLEVQRVGLRSDGSRDVTARSRPSSSAWGHGAVWAEAEERGTPQRLFWNGCIDPSGNIVSILT